jgi:hypothetical protein
MLIQIKTCWHQVTAKLKKKGPVLAAAGGESTGGDSGGKGGTASPAMQQGATQVQKKRKLPLTAEQKSENKAKRKLLQEEAKKGKRSAFESRVMTEAASLIGDVDAFLMNSLVKSLGDQGLGVMLGEESADTFIRACINDDDMKRFYRSFVKEYIEMVGKHAVSSKAKVGRKISAGMLA